MEGLIVKENMNNEEINHWLDNSFEYFKHLKGSHTVGKWSIYIGNSFNTLTIIVKGYNGIEFGDIYVDYGFTRVDTYYPTIKFHSTLQGGMHKNRMVGTKLHAVIYPTDEPITLEMLIKLTEQSWDIVKDFLNE